MLREKVITSPRKFTGRTPWATLWLALKLLARSPAGIRRREHASFWYDGKR